MRAVPGLSADILRMTDSRRVWSVAMLVINADGFGAIP
jgi:hypothetical protein